MSDSSGDEGAGMMGTGTIRNIQNQPHDEVRAWPAPAAAPRGLTSPASQELALSDEESGEDLGPVGADPFARGPPGGDYGARGAVPARPPGGPPVVRGGVPRGGGRGTRTRRLTREGSHSGGAGEGFARGDSPPAGPGDDEMGGPGAYEEEDDLGGTAAMGLEEGGANEPDMTGMEEQEERATTILQSAMPAQNQKETMQAMPEPSSSPASGASRPSSNNTGYDPDDFAGLEVSPEVGELFQYIARYKPVSSSLDTKLKPFIPDLLPAVGDIDEFIKVPRPDGKLDELGLKVLDEPAAKQSDPTVLNLQLRLASKQANLKPLEVTRLEASEQNPQRIGNWIESIEQLHKNRPPAVVMYSNNVPEIDHLMQEWEPQMQDTLRRNQLPDENLDISIQDFAKVACAILGIPIYSNHVESLHVLFTLLLELQNNPFVGEAKQNEFQSAQFA